MAAQRDSSAVQTAYDLARWRLDEQSAYARALDTRLGVTFALSAAMIALFGSALLFASPDEVAPATDAVRAAAGLFIANIVVSAAALLDSRWRTVVDLETVTTYAAVLSGAALQEQLTVVLIEAVRGNEQAILLKSWLVGMAIVLASATAVAIAVAAVLAFR